MTTWKAEDGTKIHFNIYGSNGDGETLLLLPGLLGSTQGQWRNFIRPLSANFRVIAMDLRGHGRSGNLAPGLDPEQMMADAAGLLDHLQIETVHLAGYDLGGYLGLMLALNHPRRILTLLTLATKIYWTEEATAKMRAQLDPDDMAERVPIYADQLVQEHGIREWRSLVRQAAGLVAALNEDGLTEKMLAQIQCPVLSCVGDRDRLVSIAEALRLSQLVQQGELLVLPGVSHPYRTVRPIPLLSTMQYFHDLKNH